MTANAMKGDREICLDAGMDGYVAKPIQSQRLFEEIAQVLGRLHSNLLFPPDSISRAFPLSKFPGSGLQ
jgi:DNA-binding response OmpR family regulator